MSYLFTCCTALFTSRLLTQWQVGRLLYIITTCTEARHKVKSRMACGRCTVQQSHVLQQRVQDAQVLDHLQPAQSRALW